MDYVGFSSSVDSSPSPADRPKRPLLVKQISEGRPGPIDNTELLVKKNGISKLRADINIHYDFNIINKAVWNALLSWYGGVEGGPPLPRIVIEEIEGRLGIELLPLNLSIRLSNVKGEMIKEGGRAAVFSKVTTVGQVIKDIRSNFNFGDLAIRLWTMYSEDDMEPDLLTDVAATLEEVEMTDGQIILVEIRPSDGPWPRDKKHSMERRDSGSGQTHGIVGLQNLGNTCFMNSSLQSLSNTPLLKDYFVSGSYKYDINVTNTMGMQGKLAAIYGELVNELWTTKHRSIAPRRFKVGINFQKRCIIFLRK